MLDPLADGPNSPIGALMQHNHAASALKVTHERALAQNGDWYMIVIHLKKTLGRLCSAGHRCLRGAADAGDNDDDDAAESAQAVCARCVRTSTPTLSSSESERVDAAVDVASTFAPRGGDGCNVVGGSGKSDGGEEENLPSLSFSASFSLESSLTLVWGGHARIFG